MTENRLKLMVQGSIDFEKFERVCKAIILEGFKCTISDNGMVIFEKEMKK